jgi:cytochrome P450/catechol 2,3-dioxygenase-like lactoylglutathione lyase family enzyme
MASYLERFDETPEDKRWPMVRRWMFEESLPFFAELREYRPVLAMPELTLATRFCDCEAILRRHEAFSVAPYKPKMGDYWMAQDDTPVHWREKSIMRSILDREDIPDIRAFVADKAATILKNANGSIDAVNELARAVPIALVQERFGFADSDPKKLFEWSYWNQIDEFWNYSWDGLPAATHDDIVAKHQAANVEMGAYLGGLAQRRGKELQEGQKNNDPLTRLLRLALSGGLRFDPVRAVFNTGGLLVGAVETTSHAVINAIAGLLDRPQILAEARAAAAADDPAGFDGYVFEAMRFKPAFPYFFRTCEQATVLSGDTDHATEVKPGTIVFALTHSAMFDSAVFADAECFDPKRPTSNMFHFGLGIHECLGIAIGYVMIPEIVRQVLRLPGLEAAGPIDRRGGPVPEYFPIRWNTSARATLTAAEPQLFVADIKASCDFFIEKLGFTVGFVYGEPTFYAQVKRDGARIDLRCVARPVIDPELRERESLLAAAMTVETAGELKQLFLEFQSAGVAFHQALKREPWGASDFIVKDPDGNLLLFAGPAA